MNDKLAENKRYQKFLENVKWDTSDKDSDDWYDSSDDSVFTGWDSWWADGNWLHDE